MIKENYQTPEEFHSSCVPTRRDSELMREILTMKAVSTSRFPDSVSGSLPEFVPKERRNSAKETKIISLYGQKGEDFVSGGVLQRVEEEHPEYPLTKMVEVQDPKGETKRTRKSFDHEIPLIPPEEYLNSRTLSAKGVKQLYDLRSQLSSPFANTVTYNEENITQTNSLQDEYNRKLAELRNIQPIYSDIFCLSDLTTTESSHEDQQLPCNAVPNRSLRLVHEEIQPSGDHAIYRTVHKEVKESARERYLRELSESDSYGVEKPARQSALLASENLNHRTGPIPSQQLPFLDCGSVPPISAAKVFMLRIWGVPRWITEEQFVEGIRKCRCHVVKIWFPLNVILGHHKGVGSLVIRESWNPDRLASKSDYEDTDFERSKDSLGEYGSDAPAINILLPNLKKNQVTENCKKTVVDEKRSGEVSIKYPLSPKNSEKNEEKILPEKDMKEQPINYNTIEPLVQLLEWFKSLGIEAEVEQLMTEI